jgi:hypothetical protein
MTRISAFEFCFKKWAQKIGFLPSVAGQGLKNAKLPSALIEDNPGEIGAFMRGGELGQPHFRHRCRKIQWKKFH